MSVESDVCSLFPLRVAAHRFGESRTVSYRSYRRDPGRPTRRVPENYPVAHNLSRILLDNTETIPGIRYGRAGSVRRGEGVRSQRSGLNRGAAQCEGATLASLNLLKMLELRDSS